MDLTEMEALVAEIGYRDGYELTLKRDQRVRVSEAARAYLQVRFWRKDTVTGEMGWGYSGKSYVSEAMTVTEFLNAAFGVFVRLEEHECREAFTWRGRAINGPHVSAEARWEIARRVDVRPPQRPPDMQAFMDLPPATAPRGGIQYGSDGKTLNDVLVERERERLRRLDAQVDALHGPGAAEALDKAIADGVFE